MADTWLRDEIIGPEFDRTPPDDIERIKRRLMELDASGTPAPRESDYLLRDEDSRPVRTYRVRDKERYG